MDKITPEELLNDIEKLFEYDNYEEVVYPIIRNYLLYRLGKLSNLDKDKDWYEIDCINNAFSILGRVEWIK